MNRNCKHSPLLAKVLVLVCSLHFLSGVFSPLEGAISLAGDLTREFIVTPGQVVKGMIEFQNMSSQNQTVGIDTIDSDRMGLDSDGKTVHLEKGACSRSNSKWIKVFPTRVDLPPRGRGSFQYAITVPSDNSLIGSYWSTLGVTAFGKEHQEIIGGKTPGAKKITLPLTVNVRYGIKMVTHIASTGKKSLRFLSKKLISEQDSLVLRVDVENNGECLARPFVWVEIFDAKGCSMGRFQDRKLRIYPGCSVRFNIKLPKLPRGTYSSVLAADTGDESSLGAKYQLEIK